MTRRFETKLGAARAVSPIRCSIRAALACGALLGAFACQSDAEPKLQSEPARAASEPAASPSGAAHEPGAAPAVAAAPSAAPSPAAPGGQVGLARYEEPKAAAPARAADAPSAAGAGQTVKGAVVDGDSFSTWLQAVSPVPAGGPATVEAVLVAKGGYHCNADYPHKFKLGAAPAGLSYPEATVKGMQVTAERSVLRIPVVAQNPGTPTVAGTLQFSVCNDERCLIEKRELSLNLEVK